MNLSKSRYCSGVQCKKILWLEKNKPEEKEEQNNESVLENGNKVHEYARKLFGKYTNIEYNSDLNVMISDTQEALEENANVITEASFVYNNNFASIDILKKVKNGYEIYEVKSSTEIKDIFIDDISYQYYILNNLNMNIVKCFIVYINNKYIKDGEIDLGKLFIKEEVTNIVLEKLKEVEDNIKEINTFMENKKEPGDMISENCVKPYDCPFFKYCTKHLPSPNVFDVGCYVRFDKKLEMYRNNKVSYEDILSYGGFNENANEQMNFEINNLKPKINIDNIKSFLKTITYPIYFLDFESYQAAIPTIDGTKPYQQICFQDSLHYYLSKEDKTLYHKEFLSDDYEGNPMYGLCKRLCEDIPMNTSVIVYNQSFEKTRLKEMANLFPEFKEHLLNIDDNIIDLLPIFKNHDYYVKEMNGSSSIKKVLPSLFPNEPDLDYNNLKQVHKGDEASAAFLSLKDLNKKDEEILRYNMLKYCKLDTLAMVKIYDKLLEVIK